MLYVIIDRCTMTGSNCHQTFMGSNYQAMMGCNFHRAMRALITIKLWWVVIVIEL